MGFDENRFSVPLTIVTEQGNFERFVPIDLTPQPTDQNAAATPTIPIGLAAFFMPRNILLVTVIIALIALIIYLALKGGKEAPTEPSEIETTDYSFAEAIKEKPKPKRKRKKKR